MSELQHEIIPEKPLEKELAPLDKEPIQDKHLDKAEQREQDKELKKEDLTPEKKHAPIRKEKTTDELINNAKIKCEMDKLEKEIAEFKENISMEEELIPGSEADIAVKSPETELIIEKEPGQDMSYMLNGQRLDKEQMMEKEGKLMENKCMISF